MPRCIFALYYSATINNTKVDHLYFDPSNHINADCITEEAEKYYEYFGDRDVSYHYKFNENAKCSIWYKVIESETNRIKSYQLGHNSERADVRAAAEMVKNMDWAKIKPHSSDYWKHKKCRTARLPKDHLLGKFRGKSIKSHSLIENQRIGWNFGPWCYVKFVQGLFRPLLNKTDYSKYHYDNSHIFPYYVPRACLPRCSTNGTKREEPERRVRRKGNMIYNRKAIDSITDHYFEKFSYGSMEYYEKTADKHFHTDEFKLFTKWAVCVGISILVVAVGIVVFCHQLDKYEAKLEKDAGWDMEAKDQGIDNFFQMDSNENVEEEKMLLHDRLIVNLALQIKTKAELEKLGHVKK
uniref:Kringle domain-containing protein n=1 Tax=Rhabditophanes sp. KR3021 TaxID=114890 RepID=A0AC35TIV3_9BILA